MKSSIRAVAAIALISAGGAWAVAKGGKLYIKSKDTKVLKDPKAGATAVVTVQPGTEVVWNGASDKDKAFHDVSVKGKQGFVLMSNLSPNQVSAELDASSGKPMSAQAFASSGAATKALTPAAIKYSETKKGTAEESAAMVIYVEEHNRAKGTTEAIAMKSKELGGTK